MSRATALANLDRAHEARREIAQQRLHQARQLATEGLARHEIADQLGITREWFTDWIRTNDPDLARQLPSTSRPAAERMAEIRWMADSGESFHSIAARLGIKPESLERRLYRHGQTDLLHQLRKAGR